jgi:Choline dehydrogenase and related flavoproteins
LGLFPVSRHNTDGPEWPDIQLFFASAADNDDGGLFNKRNNGLKDDYYAGVFEPILYRDSITLAPLLLRPRSRGRIKLRTADPLDHPMIRPNYLYDEKDLKTLVSGEVFFSRGLIEGTVTAKVLSSRNRREKTG